MNRAHVAGACLAACLLLEAPVATAQDDEFTWPRTVTGEKGEVVIYQPQIEALEGDILQSRAAVAVKVKGQEGMTFGAMWFESRLATDLETRTATLVSTKVTATRFPDVEQEKVDRLSRYLEAEIPAWDLVLSLDHLIAALPGGDGEAGAGLRAEPPAIHVRTTPAVLVLIDGDPILQPLPDHDLEYVVNSAFFIAKDERTGYWLRGSGMWFTSTDVGGPWRRSDDLPAEVAKVSRKIDEDEAAQAEDQAADAEALGVARSTDEPPPEIIVSTVPAELIVTEGEPDLAPIPGTDLLHLRNTESDVLMDIAAQRYYLLVAGRWYRAPSLSDGPWEFVPFEELPAGFADIPADSDMATVLASVPGTVEAREALLETQIPQTAEVDRKTATCSVAFDGEPQFEVCADNDVAYARNSSKPVLLIAKRYYCVDDAVWFEADGPQGPWAVATAVPSAVQDIPPECPVYNVKYVHVYHSTPEVVYVGYTPGYYGSYAWGPCVVYGTGWYYRPWWGSVYYPRPVTYGFGVHYNPYSGWGFSFGISYGWLSIGVGWGRPAYGCWGPGGYRYGYRRGYWHGYNRGYAHGYRRGAAAGYRAGHRAAQRERADNLYKARRDGVKRTGEPRRRDGKRPAATDRRNDVYADRKGDLYRDRDGTWEKLDRDGRPQRDRDAARDRPERDGQPPDTRDRQPPATRDQQPPATRDRQPPRQPDRAQPDTRNRGGSQQLDRDRAARNRGSQRQRQAPPVQRSAPPRGGGGRRGR